MLKIVRKLVKNKSAATAIEYGLIAALVSVAAIAALSAMGTSLRNMFQHVSDCLTDAQAGTSCTTTTTP